MNNRNFLAQTDFAATAPAGRNMERGDRKKVPSSVRSGRGAPQIPPRWGLKIERLRGYKHCAPLGLGKSLPPQNPSAQGNFVWPSARDWLESLWWVAATFTVLIALSLAGSFVNYEEVVLQGHPWLPLIHCEGCCFCGMTRSFCAMASGHWRAAAQWNQGGPILYISGWLWLLSIAFYFFRQRVHRHFTLTGASPGKAPEEISMRRKLICIFVLSVVTPRLLAQQVYTPALGNPERKAIVDALRVPIAQELKKAVIFQVSSLRVKDDWAVIWAAPLQPNGQPFDYRNTPYEKCRKRGDCDDSIGAVLRKQNGAWTVAEYAIGPTDVPAWGTGRKKYKLPEGLQ